MPNKEVTNQFTRLVSFSKTNCEIYCIDTHSRTAWMTSGTSCCHDTDCVAQEANWFDS